MENINIFINKKTRQVNLSKSVIGNDGENLQENLIFSFDEFVDGTGRLEIIKHNSTPSYIMLTKVNNTYQLPVKSIITKGGRITMQLVITEGTNNEEIPIFKSNEFYMVINSSINAEIEEPEEYPEWIDVANTKLNELDNIDIDVEKVNHTATITITKKDGTEEIVNIYDGEKGDTGNTGQAGKDAKINGVNTLTLEAGDNITLNQSGSTLTISSTGGSGGTTNYNNLSNKPKINNVELSGNKTTSDLGLFSGNYNDLTNKPTIPINSDFTLNGLSEKSYNNLTDKPTIPVVPTNVSAFNNDAGYLTRSTSDSYSTTETIIGTWKDGKPIYRKVMTGTIPSVSGVANIGLISSNLDTIVRCDGFIESINTSTTPILVQKIPFLYMYNPSREYNTYYIENGNIMFRTIYAGFTGKDFYVIVEYTKTTD